MNNHSHDSHQEKRYIKGLDNSVCVSASVKTREPMTRDIYDYYRPNESVPKWGEQESQQDIMKICSEAYYNTGIVRQTIDAMAEWVSDGIKITYSAPAGQQFMDDWSKKVKLKDRVERFANWVLRVGNVVVRRRYGTLKNVKIPTGYMFYAPWFVYVAGDHLSGFTQKKRYSVRIFTNDLSGKQYSTNPLTESEKKTMPKELLAVLSGKPVNKNSKGLYVDIPEDGVYVASYKKDDNEIWAVPFLYSALSEIKYNDKLSLAKSAMLDGMINPVRIWKLGNSDKEMAPSPAAYVQLEEIVEKNTGGGSTDIVWDDMIELDEHYPPIEKMEYLDVNYDDILWALGIYVYSKNINDDVTPLGIRTLVQRVQYVREMVVDWLNAEIDIIKQSTGFRGGKFNIEFTYADFTTEEAYRRMLLDLVDRNIVSDKRILEILKQSPDSELSQVNLENSERNNKDRSWKAGPYTSYDLHQQNVYEKDREKRQAVLDQSGQNTNNLIKQKPGGKQGRPPGAKDGTPRKRTKKSFASCLIDEQKRYQDIFNKNLEACKEVFAKSDVRQFTSDEKDSFEKKVQSEFLSVLENDVLSEKILSSYHDQIKDLGINITTDQRRLIFVTTFVEILMEDSYENI